ncbi:DUF2637 domain-containing protein [Microbacterium sp. YY-01]|uniref:DUF2637 domain-containing protein n=1 Tax=Microbacterium sp. YY-01 TaxID=3421634 RepID=UPI003D1760C2
MSDLLTVGPQNKALAVLTALGVAGLAIGGFTLSFTALRELAIREFAIASSLAFIYPLVIDGFIVIATAAAFTMKKRGPRATWYPWSALGVFGALSVLGNAAHAIDSPTATFPAWVSALGASVPAIALLVSSHLMMLMLSGKTKTRATRPTKTERSTQTTAKDQRSVPSVQQQTTTTPRKIEPTPQVADQRPARRLHAVESTVGSLTLKQLQEVVASGERITPELFVQSEGVSDRTGRRRIERLRKEHPELFEQEQKLEIAQ